MKRDMDLARDILRYIEEKAQFDDHGFTVEIPDRAENDVKYHLQLLEQAGLVELDTIEFEMSEPEILAKGLTWEGHEFLDHSRNNAMWAKAKAALADKGTGWSFELLKSLLVTFTKAQLGLPG